MASGSATNQPLSPVAGVLVVDVGPVHPKRVMSNALAAFGEIRRADLRLG